ncbi:MAG: hypothetical protein VX768_17100 [Planctomycetota bacterium]|nr:hypothetical protein [Planctomycetota bacterium]
MQYFVKRGEKVKGPFDRQQLQDLVTAGKVKLTDSVASDELGPFEVLEAKWHEFQSSDQTGSSEASNFNQCPFCGASVFKNATSCPQCSRPLVVPGAIDPLSGAGHGGIPQGVDPLAGVPQSGFAQPYPTQHGGPMPGGSQGVDPLAGVPQSGFTQPVPSQPGVPQAVDPLSGVGQGGIPQGVPQQGVPQQGVPQSGFAQPIPSQAGGPQAGHPAAANGEANVLNFDKLGQAGEKALGQARETAGEVASQAKQVKNATAQTLKEEGLKAASIGLLQSLKKKENRKLAIALGSLLALLILGGATFMLFLFLWIFGSGSDGSSGDLSGVYELGNREVANAAATTVRMDEISASQSAGYNSARGEVKRLQAFTVSGWIKADFSVSEIPGGDGTSFNCTITRLLETQPDLSKISPAGRQSVEKNMVGGSVNVQLSAGEVSRAGSVKQALRDALKKKGIVSIRKSR